MKKTWILAAHRGGAKLYEHTTPGTLSLVREVDHPQGRLQNREIWTDKPGRKFETSAHRSGAGPEVDPVRKEAEDFARTLAATLADGRNAHAYDRLILMAEPRFLGLLRDALDAQTAATVTASVNHELTNAPVDEVKRHLREHINV